MKAIIGYIMLIAFFVGMILLALHYDSGFEMLISIAATIATMAFIYLAIYLISTKK
jgi:hypothetical protein